ncbi:MAG TPA: hypothetical protein DCP28_07420, partial [Cytophagales bacterium]|nr:hypothetical protein [Cytophagales bacterium]
RTNVLSLGIDANKRIYLGAQDEIGYMVTNALGQATYQSLNDIIPEEHRGYGLVWRIIAREDKMYFFTNRKILVYEGGQMDAITMAEELIFAQKVNGQFYLQQKGRPLAQLQDGNMRLLPGTEPLAEEEIKGLYSVGEKLIVLTADQGVFEWSEGTLAPWETTVNEAIAGQKVNMGQQLADGKLAVGTIKDGLYVFSPSGEMLLHITKEQGLQNNTIQAIYEDDNNNLWLALGNGISYVELGSDFYYMDARSDLDGSVYSSAIYDGYLYAATNQGTYRAPLHGKQSHPFAFVEGTDVHNWNLTQVDETLLLGNHLGAHTVDGATVTPLNVADYGAWQFIRHPKNPNLLYQGCYTGVYVYEWDGRAWQVLKKLDGYVETAREMIFDEQGYLWIGHGYHGIYRLTLNPEGDEILQIDLYDQSKGLPTNLWNNLFKVQGNILIGTQQGVYEYEPDLNAMVPSAHYQEWLGDTELVRKLVEMPDGSILYIKGLDNFDQIGILREDDTGGYHNQTIPFQKLRGELIPAFESVTFYGDQILFGAKDGLVIYQQDMNRPTATFSTNISRVFCTAANDSLLYGDPGNFAEDTLEADFVQTLEYDHNALKIQYAATYFERSDNVEYRTFLEGFDEETTLWTTATSREFTNLKEGTYTFTVESRNIYGAVGQPASYAFTILPPWYRTWRMYLVYAMGFGFIGLGMMATRRRKLRELERQKQFELHQQREELLRKNLETEQKMTQLQMEKLQSEVDYKSKELATSTIHLAQQNDTVLKAIERIEAISTIKDEAAIKQLKGVASSLKDLIAEESNWEQFELHFNEIHDNFIKRLKTAFPKLTARDVRLCAYLRMNLASKEIAPLMGISYRGVEALRYRIRKKLELSPDDNLTGYILEF